MNVAWILGPEMPNFAIVVEGAHDASFLGQILKANGFSQAKMLNDVPDTWRILFPKAFPVDGQSLNRVIRFPEILTKGDLAVGISTSGSDSKLISTLRSVLDALGTESLKAAAIFVDIDQHHPTARFQEIRRAMIAMNNAANDELQPGYPVVVPDAAGLIKVGAPSVGIFMFPDNVNSGALESILIECALHSHPRITEAATCLVDDLNSNCPINQSDMKNLRKGMGTLKAKAGVVANLLMPGTSLAVSLAQTNWLQGDAFAAAKIVEITAFLRNLIGEDF